MKIDGLDPQAADLLRLTEGELTLDDGTEDVDAQRRAFKSIQSRLADYSAHEFDGEIADTIVERDGLSVPARRYEPRVRRSGAGVVYFHGGGWVLGDIDTVDRFARAIARTLRVTVLSVDYRLAPEHPFPAALEDCAAVAAFARAEFGGWCAVAGDSAGGNLAAAVALGAPPNSRFDAQLLLYPCLDMSMTGDSYEQFADGFGLTRESMRYFWDVYGADERETNPLLSPLNAEDLSGLPPTVVVTAGFDVLLDDGRNYAQRLIQSGVPTTYLPYLSLPHGFIETVDRVDSAKKAVKEVLASFEALAATHLDLR